MHLSIGPLSPTPTSRSLSSRGGSLFLLLSATPVWWGLLANSQAFREENDQIIYIQWTVEWTGLFYTGMGLPIGVGSAVTTSDPSHGRNHFGSTFPQTTEWYNPNTLPLGKSAYFWQTKQNHAWCDEQTPRYLSYTTSSIKLSLLWISLEAVEENE